MTREIKPAKRWTVRDLVEALEYLDPDDTIMIGFTVDDATCHCSEFSVERDDHQSVILSAHIQTLAEIAHAKGVTKQYIHQLEAKALARLHTSLIRRDLGHRGHGGFSHQPPLIR
jgi:hypothetical protein